MMPLVGGFENADRQQRATLCEQILSAWAATISGARRYDEVHTRAATVANEMAAAGFRMNLLDEDAESMVAYGATISSSERIVIQCFWDATDGVSASISFIAPEGRCSLNYSERSES